MGNFIFLVILLPKEESFFNPIQVGPFRGWSRMGGGGVGGGGGGGGDSPSLKYFAWWK